jgi:hypothetical protein
MMRTRRLLPLTLVSLSCAHAPTLRPAPYFSIDRVLPDRPTVVAITDSALSSLGLPSLAAASLPPGYRELRISGGHGMVLGDEYPLVRIVESQAGIIGDVIRFRAILNGSGDTVRIVRWAARVARPSAPIDWRRVAISFDAAGIENVHSPNYSHAYMDAGDLVVEVLRGASYRAYEVNAPRLRTDSIGVEAARITALIDSLDRLTGNRR